MVENDPTDTDRALAFSDIKAWAESLGEDDYHPMVVLDILGKTFTPQELVEDLKDGTAVAEALLDVMIIESKKERISPVEYAKRVMKLNTGKVVRGKFWFEEGRK